MLLFSQTADRIAATTKKSEKTAILAEYFRSVPVEEAAVAAVFFSGRPFPVWEETILQVGGSLLWRIVAELSGKSEEEVTKAYRKHGDLGAVAEAVLPSRRSWSDGRPRPSGLDYPPSDIQRTFREISAARGPAAKGHLVRELLGSVSPLEAKYVIKIMTGDLRIGLKESLVEEAIGKAFEAPLRDVQRANMLLGDIGETLKLAAEHRLPEAKMRLFHPIGFMLASPAESAVDALSYFQNAWVEDKYDGIRAQAHCSGDAVRFFSRTRDEITESFPELPDALAGLPEDAILDGEIVAWSYMDDAAEEGPSHVAGRASSGNEPSVLACRSSADNSDDTPVEAPHQMRPNSDRATNEDERANENAAPKKRPGLAHRFSAGERTTSEASPGGTTETSIGRALPFSALQQRLGRKKVSERLIQDVPVAYVVFDILYANGELLIDRSLLERAKILDDLLGRRTPFHHRDTLRLRSGQAETGRKRFPGIQGFLNFSALPSDSREPKAESPLPATHDLERATVPRSTHDVLPATNFPTTEDRRPTTLIRAPVFGVSSADELNALFDAAQARGNEGLMIKDPESPYTPGRRGKSWLKLKRELATLDVVVTAVEYGHGRRIGVLSDYTFAVRDGERLLNVGKAYSGLTDSEIIETTEWFLSHTMEDHGFRRIVEPKIVIEVAFNNVMKSDRHASGYALRFPRIVRLRPDKLLEEIDTLTTVQEIFDGQHKRKQGQSS